MALARERLEFHGETIELPLPDGPGKALKLTIAPVQERIPIYLAAIGPQEHRAGRRDRRRLDPDAALPRAPADAAQERSRRARRAPGRSLDDFDIAPTVNVYITDDDVDGARDAMRPFMALYVGGMGSREQNFYNTLVQRYGFEDAARTVQDLYLEGKQGGGRRGAARRADRPGVARSGRADRVRERLRAYRDAGVGTLGVSPMAWTRDERIEQLRLVAELAEDVGLRVAAGRVRRPGPRVPDHRARPRAARRAGTRSSSRRGRAGRTTSSARGMRFAPAPEYHVFPTLERPLKPYEAVVRATRDTRALVRAERPDVVVADILTLAPALAAELEGVPCATLIPHVDPRGAPGFPPYSLGARLPRTAVGRADLGRVRPAGRARRWSWGARSSTRRARGSGCAPLDHVHGGISRELALVATFPQLEYPRPRPGADDARRRAAAVGAAVRRRRARRPATSPLVLVAPSTAQDPEQPAAARGARRPRRPAGPRAGATNRRGDTSGFDVPPNARLVDWVSYARTMPRCDLVVCHGGHGTLDARADLRLRRRRLPRRRRHERERRPRRLGRRRRPPPPPPHRHPRPPPGRPARARRRRPPRPRSRDAGRLGRGPRSGRSRPPS